MLLHTIVIYTICPFCGVPVGAATVIFPACALTLYCTVTLESVTGTTGVSVVTVTLLVITAAYLSTYAVVATAVLLLSTLCVTAVALLPIALLHVPAVTVPVVVIVLWPVYDADNENAPPDKLILVPAV